MSKFYQHDIKDFTSCIQNENQAIEAMEYLYDILLFDDNEKQNAFNIMMYIMRLYPIVQAYFRYIPNEWYYENRIRKTFASYVPASPIVKKEIKENTIPEIHYEEDCFPGLYFIGQIGYNPILNKNIYFVKVGQTSDISKRIKTYLGYNPLIYYNHSNLPCQDTNLRKAYESICHEYLSHYAINMGQNSFEMFQVSEENYFKLCEQFSDTNTFHLIATNVLHP